MTDDEPAETWPPGVPMDPRAPRQTFPPGTRAWRPGEALAAAREREREEQDREC